MEVDMLLLDSQYAKLTEQWKWFDGKILYQFMYMVTVSSYFDRSIITRLFVISNDEQQQYRQKPENREQQKLKSLKRNRDKTGSRVLIVDHPHNDSER
ncbi:hypothetical protein YC2023_018865 [Brassica napus]